MVNSDSSILNSGFYFSVPRSSFIVSLDVLSARLLGSNSGLFAEGQADFEVSRPASFAPRRRALKERDLCGLPVAKQ